MSERYTSLNGGEQRSEDGVPGAEAYKEGEHFGLTPEEERRGTPLQQEIASDVPVIAGEQDEPVPNGPVPGEPNTPDPAQPVPDPNKPDPMQPVPEPNRPDPMRPYPEPGEPDPTRPLPGKPVPPQP